MTNGTGKLTRENFESMALMHRDRQAGVSMIYDPARDIFVYNAYCIELKLLKELFSRECDTLDQALDIVNEEFTEWSLATVSVEQGGCPTGSCQGCCGMKHHKEE